ncbi:hypothetical protein N2152v2_005294 [Parachlorella kessleri]
MNCLLALLVAVLLACVSAAPLTDWVDGVAKSFGGAQLQCVERPGYEVECAPDGNVTFDIDQYRATEGGYIRLAVEQLAGSAVVQSVELRKSPVVMDRLSVSGSQWIKLGNTYGARWEVSGLPSPPLDMRITGENPAQPLIIRQALKVAGEGGTFTTPVQFPTAAQPRVVTDGTLAANAKLPSPATCQDTLCSYLQQDPDLSMLKSFIDKAGIINLQDAEILQHVVLFLVAGGQIIMPDASAMLPEDVERGGIKLVVDTLQGTSLTAVGTPTQLVVSDGSSLTSDAIVVEDNIIVCNSAVNKLSEVPLPFP